MFSLYRAHQIMLQLLRYVFTLGITGNNILPMFSFLVVFLGTLLAGCVTPPLRQPIYGYTPPEASELCEFQAAHAKNDGVAMPEGYYCIALLSPIASTTSRPSASEESSGVIPIASTGTGHIPSGCGYVAAYIRSDGTAVGPFVRCATSLAAASYRTQNATTQSAPCVSSYCGPVSVRGYYRKDGTYVRPHTRKR
jgi:hypothetical protein